MKDIMDNKCTSYILSGFLIIISLSGPCYAANELTPIISDIITECQSIKPGMTRADLYRVFGTEGGMYSARDRSFVYHACPYIKVDVSFTLSSSDQHNLDEQPTDIIRYISKPYLEWSVSD